MLDYLTQGDISPILENLLELVEFDYINWERELDKLDGVEDARELRGSSARLLASSPFNPGLLFARAYAEIIHPEGDRQDFMANLEASLNSARDRYGISQSALSEFASRLLVSLETSSFYGMAEVIDMVDRLGLAKESTAHIFDKALKNPGYNSGIRVLALENWLTRLSEELKEAIEEYRHDR